MKRVNLSLGVAFLTLQASGALAQTPATPVAGQRSVESEGAQSTGLEEIVVTAQRRSENLQKAAVAISAVSGDDLRSAGISRPTELTAIVPALQVAAASGPFSIFYLRGVGNFNSNALSDAAVAFNFNGVVIGRPSSTTGFFYDLQRVEVLKGPQGTLYGRNATGGAINVIAKAPDLDTLGGQFSAEYGNYDAIRLDGAINAPIGADTAIRAAAVYVKHDGYMKDGTDDQNDVGLRLSFKTAAIQDLTISVVADYFDQGGRGPGSTPLALGIDNRDGVSSLRGQQYYRSQPVSIAGRNFNGIPNVQSLNNHYWGISSTLEWAAPFGTVTIIPAYRKSSLNYVGTSPGFFVSLKEKDDQFTVEARIASDDSKPLRYVAGLFYYDETNKAPEYLVNAQYNISTQVFETGTESVAAFGRLTYELTDTFRLTAGGRYTIDDKIFKGTLSSFNKLCLPIPTARCPAAQQFPYNAGLPTFTRVGSAAVPQANPAEGTLVVGTFIDSNDSAKFKRFTWRAGVEWDIAPQSLFYASYETGFKSGGFFFSNDARVYRPETIKAFTVGSKNRFLDNRLQLNLELFHWRYTDQQISHTTQDSTGTIVFATENVGRATMKGAEIETRFLLTPHTTLSADVQYLDAKYNNFTYNVPRSYPLSITGCAQGPATPTLLTLNCSGFRPPNAPEWTINLSAQQAIPVGDGELVLAARTHFQSRTLTGLEFSAIENQPSYWMHDASITYSAAQDRFYVTAFINNISDEAVLGNTFPATLSSFIVGSIRPPRTYGLRAGFNF